MLIKTKFDKYRTQGVNYHYQQINKSNFLKFNPFLLARYQIFIDLIISNIKKYFKKRSCLKILDLGCGDGVLLHLLQKRLERTNYKLYGVDSIEKALITARKKIPSAKFIKSDIKKLKFGNNSFDLIISSDVIEHIKNTNKVLKEIKRVIKNNGIAIISTPIRFTEFPQDKFHVHEFFPNECKKFLENYFCSVTLIKSHKLLYFLLYKKSINLLGKKIYIFQILINFITIAFNFNPFLIKATSDSLANQATYMFLVCRNKKNEK